MRFDRSYVSYPVCCPSRATYLTGQYAHNHGVMGLYPPDRRLRRFDKRECAAGLASARRIPHRAPRQVPERLRGPGARGRAARAGATGTPRSTTPRTRCGATRSTTTAGCTRTGGRSTRTRGSTRPTCSRRRRRRSSRARPAARAALPVAELPRAAPRGARVQRGRHGSCGPRRAIAAPSPALPFRMPRASTRRTSPTSRAFAAADPPAHRPRHRIDPSRRHEHAGRRCWRSTTAWSAFVSALRRSGELDETYIIFTSDNGYMQGEHRVRSGKMLPYEPSTHVPLHHSWAGHPGRAGVSPARGQH